VRSPASRALITEAACRPPCLAASATPGTGLPSASMIDFLRAAPRREQLLLHYAGDVGVALQHVGVLIGDTAHREIWPRILRWLRQLDTGSSNPEDRPLPASK